MENHSIPNLGAKNIVQDAIKTIVETFINIGVIVFFTA